MRSSPHARGRRRHPRVGGEGKASDGCSCFCAPSPAGRPRSRSCRSRASSLQSRRGTQTRATDALTAPGRNRSRFWRRFAPWQAHEPASEHVGERWRPASGASTRMAARTTANFNAVRAVISRAPWRNPGPHAISSRSAPIGGSRPRISGRRSKSGHHQDGSALSERGGKRVRRRVLMAPFGGTAGAAVRYGRARVILPRRRARRHHDDRNARGGWR